MSRERELHPAKGMSSIPRIRDGREDDIELLADVLTRAFSAEPYWDWAFTGGARAKARKLHRYKVIQLRSAFMSHLVVRTTEDCSGVAIWTPPGSTGLRPPLRLFPQTVLVFGRAITRNLGVYREINRHIPKTKHWFLSNIGVDPKCQGRRIGSLLVADGLARAEADRVPVILETSNPDNVAWYEKLGFVLYDHYHIRGRGPQRWFFRRDPER